jgi:hypothetical protein
MVGMATIDEENNNKHITFIFLIIDSFGAKAM